MFFVSGISGLIFQIIWVRLFGLFFGNTVYSASIITAVFMLGLGLGAFGGGYLADKINEKDKRQTLKWYAIAELSIATLGVFLTFSLPMLESITAQLSHYTISSNGWNYLSLTSHMIRYLIVFILIFPITLLMGSTLTFVIRYILANQLENGAWKIGLLYGFNTLGAAVACLIIDFLLVPNLGLQSTQLLASLLNLIAALMAFKIFNSVKTIESPVKNQVEIEQAREPYFLFNRVLLVLFLSGFAAMGLEIFWFRFLNSSLGQLRSVFSLLLATILISMWLGSSSAGLLCKKIRSPKTLLILSQWLMVLSSLLSIFVFTINSDFLSAYLAELNSYNFLQKNLLEIAMILFPVLKLVAIPAFFMGMAYPLANAIVQKNIQNVGKNAGLIYFFNTLGAIFGSIVTGFIFLPLLGMKITFIILILMAILSITPLFYQLKEQLKPFVGILISTLIIFSIFLFSYLTPKNYLIEKSFRSMTLVERYFKEPFLKKISEGINEILIILEIPGGKDQHKDLRLYTNGHIMSGTAEGAQRYMRAFTHIPLLYSDAPSDVLVICFGVGNTLQSASLHPTVKNLDVVDLSENILNHSDYFHKDLLHNKKISVFINDGRQHLKMPSNTKYDLITLEPPPLSFSGVESLYTKEFYQLAANRLNHGGFVTQWLPITHLSGEISMAVISAFMKVFPESVLLAGEYNDLILMGRKEESINFDPLIFKQRLMQRTAVYEDMKKNNMGSLLEIAGMFVSDKDFLLSATKDIFPISDNYPQMEYSHLYLLNSIVPLVVYQESRLEKWCPSCFIKNKPIEDLKLITDYLLIMKSMRRHSSYFKITPIPNPQLPLIGFPMSEKNYIATLKASHYLTRLSSKWVVDKSKFK
jgi:spermidine synthase